MLHLTAKNSDFDRFAGSYEFELQRAMLPGSGEGAKYARIKAAHLRRQIAAALGSRTKPCLLDAGCGVGITDELLKPYFPLMAGFDVSPESVRLARSRNPEIRYELSDGSSFPFGSNEFDVVFAICVLHHISPDQRHKFFREAHRVLRPGGIFLIYEHNPWNFLSRWVVARCPFDREASLLSAGTCQKIFRRSGFSLVRGGSLIFLPFETLAWRVWEEKWLSSIPLGAQYFTVGRKSLKEPKRI